MYHDLQTLYCLSSDIVIDVDVRYLSLVNQSQFNNILYMYIFCIPYHLY